MGEAGGATRAFGISVLDGRGSGHRAPDTSEAPGRTLRITELASRAYLSGSRTTRLVDELIADPLVAKERHASDARGFDVTLTNAGLGALQQAYAGHLRSVRSRVMDHVAPSALSCFAETMTAIAERCPPG
jgi:DNA-binding MarR family transcriptional regulator